MKKRAREVLLAAFLLLGLLLWAASCGQEDAAGDTRGNPETALEPGPSAQSRVAGWLEVLLPTGSPAIIDAAPGGARTWFLLPGDRALLCYDSSSREWSSFRIGDTEDGNAHGEFIALAACGDQVHLLSSEAVTSFVPDGEAVTMELPACFEPVAIAVHDGGCAVLGADGRLALPDDENGFMTSSPDDEMVSGAIGSSLFRVEPDWAFLADGSVLCRYDAEVDLWQYENVPAGVGLAERSGVLYRCAEDGSVSRRAGRENWLDTGLDGTLYPEGLVLTDAGVFLADDPSDPVAVRPAIEPGLLLPSGGGEIIWAADDIGLIAHAALGSIRTALPDYDAEMIACTVAGQAARQTTGATGGVMPVVTAGAGVFRIYESVSSRPDPFAEFPALGHDLRRDLTDVTIEELRLVGITIDPVGGDQALVEDAEGVAFILYEGTELANNTEVAEISSNEVVVVQEVTVDYGAERGGVAVIPTIYTMRLHEEGGL